MAKKSESTGPEGEEYFDSHATAQRRADARRENRAEMERLLKLAWKLVESTEGDFKRMPLDDTIRHQATVGRKIRSLGATKRQVEHVAKLLASSDFEALDAWFSGAGSESVRVTKGRETERLMASLRSGGDEALQAYVVSHPSADRQKLRQLVRRYSKAVPGDGAQASATRALKAYLLQVGDDDDG